MIEEDFETNDTLRFTEQLNITQESDQCLDTFKQSLDSGLVLTAPDKIEDGQRTHESE
jgi:hypothetical protein